MRAFLLVALPSIIASTLVMACASGFEGVGDDDDDDQSNNVDARLTVDAPQTSSPDARIIDANTSQLPDAPIGLPDAGFPGDDGGIGGACTTHAECGAGSCCFGGLMCIPGDPLPLPPPFDCLPQ
jgi:hypothetical protein